MNLNRNTYGQPVNFMGAEPFDALPQGTVVVLRSPIQGANTATTAGPPTVIKGVTYYRVRLPGGTNDFPNTAVIFSGQIANVLSSPPVALPPGMTPEQAQAAFAAIARGVATSAQQAAANAVAAATAAAAATDAATAPAPTWTATTTTTPTSTSLTPPTPSSPPSTTPSIFPAAGSSTWWWIGGGVALLTVTGLAALVYSTKD